MTYVIVKDRKTIVGTPFPSFTAALEQASRQFGDDIRQWMKLNLRIEESRSAA